MQLDRRQNPLLLGFITVSLLLHLLLIYLVPELTLFPPPDKVPVVVELRPSEPPRVRDRELDLPPDTPETPRDQPARRLGAVDQQVAKETAPKGDAPEDSTPAVMQPAARPAPAPVPAPAKPQPQPATTQPAEKIVEPKPTGEGPAPTTAQPPPERIPDMKTLMASAERAAENVAAQHMAEMRRKYREEVEQGDAVWLDTEKDLLISFFKRFRDNIYGVWNYPQRAAERGAEGACLLRITINRDGTVQEVRLMETSGHSDLDQEAMAAVRKGAPYGKLPAAYKEEELNIFAFFQYNLTRRMIY
jgi:protein TonB